MKLALLYSGGKDSPSAALLLGTFCSVTLVTTHSGITRDWTHARSAAAELGYAFEALKLDHEVAAAAITRMVEGGYPRGGIQHIHGYTLEVVCGLDFDTVTDGIRHDDRVPSISRAQAQNFKDCHGVDYLSPLSGLGRGAVDRPVKSHLGVGTGPSEEVPKADYEGGLRHLIAAEHGRAAVDEVLPGYVQSYVHGRR